MTKTLDEIAQQLNSPHTKKVKKTTDETAQAIPKVQLIYAFNGTGKTRLSREFTNLIAPKNEDEEGENRTRDKIVYYNAFTEDLFQWDNGLENDQTPKLQIQPNGFTDWILKDQGRDTSIADNFQKYVSDTITPVFNMASKRTEITFRLRDNKFFTTSDGHSLVTSDGQKLVTEEFRNIKISKGEESLFIWSIFYTLLDEIIGILNVAENRGADQFDDLEYIFIDDPVSSLDENHLIQLAVDLAQLIKSSESQLKFVVTTHNPLFYNVLYNELNSKKCYLLQRLEDGTYSLEERHGDSNRSFSYHLYLRQCLEQAIQDNQIQKYHFTLLRNLYEKTASFLGYKKWGDLLETVEGDKDAYIKRIIQFTSHSSLSGEEVSEPKPHEKQIVKYLFNHLINNYGFCQ